MRNYRVPFIALLVILLTSLCLAAWPQQNLMYSNAELDEILAPVALYPDPLVAQMLPAATFPDQLYDADRLVRRGGSDRDIDRQDWDVSVKAMSHYPSVLHGMVGKPDWTTAVGQAYVDEPTHVMWSIQRLRLKARRLGNLSTNKYQRVYSDAGYYRIVPVQPRYIYVPQYNPRVVYVQRRSSNTSNLISFGLGLLIGSWLNRDVDWHRNRVYYHGWNGGGWIGNSRPRVNITNNYYVNSSYRNRPITVDRRVRSRDLGAYRSSIRRNAGKYRAPQGRPAMRPVKPRSNWSNNRSNARPSQGVNRRNSNGRTKSSWAGNRSNARGSQGAIRGHSNGKSKMRSPRTAPRSSWSGDHSRGKSGKSIGKSRGANGPKKAPGGSRGKSNGKGGGHGSKGR